MKENIEIIQIAIDSSDPYTVSLDGKSYKSNIIGLGKDSKVYAWIPRIASWILLK